MKKKILLLSAALSLAPSIFAGEFPDDWTWDAGYDTQYRAEHAALEGKPMPPPLL
jgi:hypothetical protein